MRRKGACLLEVPISRQDELAWGAGRDLGGQEGGGATTAQAPYTAQADSAGAWGGGCGRGGLGDPSGSIVGRRRRCGRWIGRAGRR